MAINAVGRTTIQGATTVGGFNPATLFSSGEQGVWYDPSDLSTLFQDSAGTIPVIALEQPVGRMLDKSGRGNTATQATSANRPVVSARVNLLLNTATLATQSVTTVATTYTLYFTGSGSITLSGTATGTYSAGSSSISCTAGTLTLTVSGTVTTADLRPTNQGVGLPVYQRVGAAVAGTSTTVGNADYAANGFPVYLSFDGSSDSLATGNINFSATDKMTIWTGLRKLVNSPVKVLVELSALVGSNNGSFAITAPEGATSYSVSLRGTVETYYEPSSFVAPITNTLSVECDIAASTRAVELIPRVNGVVTQTGGGGGASAGTGNFGNYPLYIGARNQASNFFNGNLYGLIVRGASSTSNQITGAENWLNQKTAAY